MALGRYMAPHIHKHGTKAISHITGQKEHEATQQVRFLYYLIVKVEFIINFIIH